MVYVFGISGVPIFELLLIVIFLMFFGLIFILFELKKLTKLVHDEKSNLLLFKKELNQFDSKQVGESPSNELVDYVKQALSQKMSRDQIETSLIESGWEKSQIDSIFEKIQM